MIKIAMVIIMILMILNAAKKTSIFGQLTLSNNRALNYVKENDKIEIGKIEMGDATAFENDYNLPTSESVGWDCAGMIAILFTTQDGELPYLVTQSTILSWLDSEAAEWEHTTGNIAKGISRNKKAIFQLVFGKEKPTVEFIRMKNVKNKKMAPYTPRKL